MIIRRPRIDELNKLKELHKQFEDEFKFPDIDKMISLYVVDKSGVVIGFGSMKPIFELTMVLDQNFRFLDRMEALSILMTQAKEELSSNGIHQMYAFVQNKKFSNLLLKRFEFEPIPGDALTRVI